MIAALVSGLRIRLAMGWAALVALVTLAPQLVSGDRVATLAASENQRHVFSLLRFVLPNIVLGRQLIKAYDNTGTAIVTRHTDVTEVLERDADFAVVYEPKMRAITAGENFFLGMQDSPAYTRDVSNMRLAVRRDDVSGILIPLAARLSAEIVAAAPGRIDVAADLTRRVPARVVAAYFGTPGSSEEAMIDGTTKMFWYLFVDLAGTEAVTQAGLSAAAAMRTYLDGAIAERHANPTDADDVLNRCLALQRAGTPGMDDLGIRNNLIGLLIGLVPTLSKASVQALAVLLDRPEALAGAQAAARADDDALLTAHVMEAFRFDPINPVIYRRTVRDSEIARGTLRARTIPKGTMVLASNLSAMFDPLAVEAPNAFRTDRPARDYILWGYGMHTCFGGHINRALMPQMLKPLLKLRGLRRAPGAAGQVQGTPFPQNFVVEFDRVT
ncbi:cytochrome P450 [Humitalea sp. 24SJ18S-53]|uniref:cytochrome P450 n=1 Tax=Humitalea sp. 24SJ18S-53 TaxID=3422307 RepID=UPI003D67262D